MTKHIDTLAEWYESAERITKTNLPNDGDTIIYPGAVDGSYVIEPDTRGWESQIVFSNEECRILHRAPAPTPAWHDAVAVIAHKDGEYGLTPRQVFVRGVPGKWESSNYYASTAELLDPVPLIEQKVTASAMRAVDALLARHGMPTSEATATAVTRAALGLDPA